MSDFHLEELASGVFARIGPRPLDPNSGIIIGDEGVTLIDTAYSPAAARDIKADIARLTAKPVSTVIISHHHFDHSWGNQVFEGARIIGQANAHAAMAADPTGQIDGIRAMAARMNVGGWYDLTTEQFDRQLDELVITPPTTTFTDRMSLWSGDRELELRHPGPGHTHGDTLVYLPAERILFGGDLVCNHLIPVVDGDPFNFVKILDEVGAMDLAALVPGHGALGGAAEARAFGSCLKGLCDEVRAARDAGAPDPRAAFEHVKLADFADWNGREMMPGSVRRIYRALDAPAASTAPR